MLLGVFVVLFCKGERHGEEGKESCQESQEEGEAEEEVASRGDAFANGRCEPPVFFSSFWGAFPSGRASGGSDGSPAPRRGEPVACGWEPLARGIRTRRARGNGRSRCPEGGIRTAGYQGLARRPRTLDIRAPAGAPADSKDPGRVPCSGGSGRLGRPVRPLSEHAGTEVALKNPGGGDHGNWPSSGPTTCLTLLV